MSDVMLTHVGGPTVLLEVGGWRLLTDPTFDPAGGHYEFGWGTASDKLAGPAVAADDIGPIDAVLLSHDQHEDNLDAAGRELMEASPTVITTVAAAARLGDRAVGLGEYEITTLEQAGKPAITVTGTPCRHGPPLSKPIVGEVTGFALAWEGQRNGQLWISGDTVLYDGVKGVAERLRVGTAIVHLGGVRFPVSGPLRYTMTGRRSRGAVRTAEAGHGDPGALRRWKHFERRRSLRRAGRQPDGRRELATIAMTRTGRLRMESRTFRRETP